MRARIACRTENFLVNRSCCLRLWRAPLMRYLQVRSGWQYNRYSFVWPDIRSGALWDRGTNVVLVWLRRCQQTRRP